MRKLWFHVILMEIFYNNNNNNFDSIQNDLVTFPLYGKVTRYKNEKVSSKRVMTWLFVRQNIMAIFFYHI